MKFLRFFIPPLALDFFLLSSRKVACFASFIPGRIMTLSKEEVTEDLSGFGFQKPKPRLTNPNA